jgi:D-ribulokinase
VYTNPNNVEKAKTHFTSDWNNALKLGYDVMNLEYPSWMSQLLKSEGIDISKLPGRNSMKNIFSLSFFLSLPTPYPAIINLVDLLLFCPIIGVVEPGFNVGTVNCDLASRLDLSKDCKVMAGTTDSIAAFLASGASKSGQAVSRYTSTYSS